MATFVQTNLGLYWGGYSLASSFNAVGLTASSSMQDDTVYGDTVVSAAAGLSSVALEGEGFWQSATDSAVFSSLGTSDTVVTVMPEKQELGSAALFTKLTTSEYNPMVGGTVGEMLSFRLSGESTNEKLHTGEVLGVPATYAATATSTPNNLGASSASQTIYSALHVYAVNSAGTLDCVIQSDDSIGFSSPANQITHNQFSAIGSEIMSKAGAVADTYWRCSFTISGSFDFTISLAIGR